MAVSRFLRNPTKRDCFGYSIETLEEKNNRIRNALIDLCEEGARAWEKNPAIILRFDLWINEVAFVRNYMNKHYPKIPHYETWIDPCPEEEYHGEYDL